MDPASIKEIKEELRGLPHNELVDICLRLSRFKKENKELLTYLLFEASDEAAYIEGIKREITEDFKRINRTSYYYIKKSVRKILRTIRKYIRYSKKKETEVELLICFCTELKSMKPSIEKNITLSNLFHRQIGVIRKAISTLHPDLQYDYESELTEII